MEMNPYVLPLADPHADLATVGGKGAALARLLRAGLPVPNGFHITTTAYQAFVVHNQLQAPLLAALAPVDISQPATLEQAATTIQQLFQNATIPAPLAEAITQAYSALKPLTATDKPECAVAVRSSATAEDLPEASFAGQQETYLNISGPAAVLDAVKRCWASLWTARAIGYRARQNIPPERVALAVVVQQLIPAEIAGILFTANPLTGRRDEVVINAAWGLGEAIVGGQVTPDTLITDKATGRVKQVQVADKNVQTVRTPTGTRTQPVAEPQRKTQVLSDAQAAALTALGRQIETLTGTPQDIEWCDAAGQWFIVQARPITTLFPLPTPLPAPAEGLRIYLCMNVVLQGITEPFTPMGWEIFRLCYVGMLDDIQGQPGELYPPWVKNAAGRMYLDLTPLLRHPKLGPTLAQRIAGKDPVASRVLAQVLATYRAELQHLPIINLPWRLWGVILPNMLGPSLLSFVAPHAAREKLFALGPAQLTPLMQRARELTTRAERLRFVETTARAAFWPAFYQVAYCVAGLWGVVVIPTLLRQWLGSDALAQPVLQALPYNPTTEMGQALLRVAVELQATHTAPTPTHPAVQEFLARFGHRAVREIDVGLPRWREDPAYLLEMLTTYMAQDNLAAKLEQFHAAQAAAEAAIPRIVAEVRQRKGPLHAWFMAHLLHCLREVGGLREQPKFDLVKCTALLRQVLSEIGQDLVAQGQLDNVEDVFYLTLADVQTDGDLRPRAAAGRAAYTRELARTAVPRLMTSTGECFYHAPTAAPDANTLVGAAVSPGVYEGIVHVVHSPLGAHLERGEILVTHSTDPSWTPLFLNAGAVVMETGGPVSHGAIVAREYGIPAVAGVSDATTRLHTGQRIRVNGEAGEVRCLN